MAKQDQKRSPKHGSAIANLADMAAALLLPEKKDLDDNVTNLISSSLHAIEYHGIEVHASLSCIIPPETLPARIPHRFT